jgi:LPXTG-site transpeptidase (sortase) family protein
VAPRPAPTKKRRRGTSAAVLTLVGVGLVAAALAIVLVQSSREPALDPHAQAERVLPAPHDGTMVLKALEQQAMEARSKSTPANAPVKAQQLAPPVRIVIPAIGVSSPVVAVGVNPDRTVQVPSNFHEAGWFAPGTKPGAQGAALIVGHVDSYKGPGVFFHLPALRRGDRFRLRLRDGSTLRYVVTSTRQVSKSRFPWRLVDRKTARSTLRLVTCGGRFDTATGHYLDNYIVFAWLYRHS